MNRRSKQLAVVLAVAILPILAFAGAKAQPRVLDLSHRVIEGGETITFFVTGGATPELERVPDSDTLLVKFAGALPGPAVTHYLFRESNLIKGLTSQILSEDEGQAFVVSLELKQWVPYAFRNDDNGRLSLQLISSGDGKAQPAVSTETEKSPAYGSDSAPASAQGNGADPGSPYRFWTPDAAVPIPEYKAGEAQQRIMEDRIFNQMITLELKDAPMQDVIRLIARRANLNIIMNQNQVQGTVTVKLDNVPLGTALDAILKTNDLAYVREEGGIVRIVPRSEVRGTREAIEMQTVNIPINWLPADNVANTLKPFMSGEGRVVASRESNSIIVTDVPPRVSEIRMLIAEIDIPEKQVLIEARMVDMSETAQRQLGVRWSAWKVDSSGNSRENRTTTITNEDGSQATILTPVDALGVAFPSGGELTRNIATGAVSNGAQWSWGTTAHVFGEDINIDVQIDALESRNLVKTLANPRVTTLNNVPALIEIIENLPYKEAVQGPSGDTTTEEVEFEEAGIRLGVLPNITNNGYVRMELKPEQKIERGRIDGVPVIHERAVEANVIVKDEATVMLGGLRQLKNGNNTEGVPWLHKVPVLGWAFKGKFTSNDKLDLVLFVTPHIIKEEPVLNTTETRQYEMIDYNWRTDEYYDRVDQQNKPAGEIIPPRTYDGVGFNR